MKHRFFISLLIILPKIGFAQVDSIAVREFMAKFETLQSLKYLLQSGDTAGCMAIFTDDAKRQFGEMQLRTELGVLMNYYRKYPKADVLFKLIRLPYNDAKGSPGHDLDGKLGLQEVVEFKDKKGKTIYYYWTWNTDTNPVEPIKHIDTKSSIERERRKINSNH